MGERWWGPVGRDTGRVGQVLEGGRPASGDRSGATAPKGPQAMSVQVAVLFGASVGLVQVAVVLLTLLPWTWNPSRILVLMYVELVAGPGVALYWASGPRFSTAPSGSAGRRRLTGALLHALGPGTLLVLMCFVVTPMMSWAPWQLTIAAWYLLCVAMVARTAYRRAHSVAKPTQKRRAEESVRSAAVRTLETEEEALAALERVRAAGDFGPGGAERRRAAEVRAQVAKERARVAAERARDPEQEARDAEQAVTEFGALLSVHPFTPGVPGVTYQQLADHSLALDAYERAKRAVAADVPGILAEGRAALERLDRRLGLDTALSGSGCFFDQRHGPAVVSVRWAPPGGAVRIVEVCQADAVRLADGELPGGR